MHTWSLPASLKWSSRPGSCEMSDKRDWQTAVRVGKILGAPHCRYHSAVSRVFILTAASVGWLGVSSWGWQGKHRVIHFDGSTWYCCCRHGVIDNTFTTTRSSSTWLLHSAGFYSLTGLCMLWSIRSCWTSQSFSKHLRQANLSMLALTVATARCLPSSVERLCPKLRLDCH